MPFKAVRRHQYWSCDVRYIEEHLLEDSKPAYVITVFENFSRMVLSSKILATTNKWDYLRWLLALLDPIRSVRERAVSLVVRTLRSVSSIWAAFSKGMKHARWVRCSCYRGARRPGRSANSSSRGEKTTPTFRADTVLTAQDHILSSIDLQGSLSLASRLQRNRARGAQRSGIIR